MSAVEGLGVQAFVLLAGPANAVVLSALADGPRSLADLRGEAGSPAQTTMRDYLGALVGAGAIERQRTVAFPGTVGYKLTAAGTGLLEVASFLETWLAMASAGPLEPGSLKARNAIRAVADGWSSGMVRALAARPLSLTELDSVISSLSYPSLERRLNAMRHLGLLVPLQSDGRSTPYGPADWLRRAVVPLIAAMRWERRYFAEEASPVTSRTIESVFLLSLPLLDLREDLDGSCRLGVQIRHGNSRRIVGNMVQIKAGRATSCTTRLEGFADAWVQGSPTEWFAAAAARNPRRVELGGDLVLAAALVEGLHDALLTIRKPGTRRVP